MGPVLGKRKFLINDFFLTVYAEHEMLKMLKAIGLGDVVFFALARTP